MQYMVDFFAQASLILNVPRIYIYDVFTVGAHLCDLCTQCVEFSAEYFFRVDESLQ